MRVALVVLGLVLGLGVVESGLRLLARTGTPLAWKLHAWDPDAAQLEPLGTSCFRARPGAVIPYSNGTVAHTNGLGWRGPEVAIPKPPGVYRVVLVGGSTVHGFLVNDDGTIDAHLREALGGGAAAARVEVVNLGLDGFDTVCDLERFRLEGERLEPDALVVHVGVNDALALRQDGLDPNASARGFRAERRALLDDRVRQHGLWRATKRHLLTARVPGIVRDLWRDGTPVPGPPEPSTAGLDAFEARVRALVSLMPADAVVLVSTPPSILARRPAPGAACGTLIVDAATTARYRAGLDARLRRVAAEPGAAHARVVYVAHALPEVVFLDDCHVNEEGNRLLAADFAGAITADRDRRAARAAWP